MSLTCAGAFGLRSHFSTPGTFNFDLFFSNPKPEKDCSTVNNWLPEVNDEGLLRIFLSSFETDSIKNAVSNTFRLRS